MLFLDLRDKQKSLAKKFVSFAQNPCFTKSFPQLIVGRFTILKVPDTVNSSANLSAWRCLANQSTIPNLVSWNGTIKSMSPGFATLSPSPAPNSNNTLSFFKNSLWTLSLLVCLVMGKLLFCHPYVWASGQNPTCMHPTNNQIERFLKCTVTLTGSRWWLKGNRPSLKS